MKIRGILFDMDGVLVDSEAVITQAAIEALAHFGIHAVEEDFKPFTGMGEIAFIGGVARKYGSDYAPEMKDLTYEIYGDMVDANLKVYENATRTLKDLSGFKRALASSADLVKIEHNLRVAEIPMNTFAAIVSADDVERKKPYPDLFLMAAKMMDIPPENCIAIDDAISGVQAAKASGALTVGITTSFDAETLKNAGASYVIDDIYELVALVNSLAE